MNTVIMNRLVRDYWVLRTKQGAGWDAWVHCLVIADACAISFPVHGSIEGVPLLIASAGKAEGLERGQTVLTGDLPLKSRTLLSTLAA